MDRLTHRPARPMLSPELRALIERMLPMADKVPARVFGSVRKAERMPRDLDIVFDADQPPFQGEAADGQRRGGHALASAPAEVASLVGCLLEEVRSGGRTPDGRPLLNVYVRLGGQLLAPNGAATWWTLVPQGASIWAKVLDVGEPLERCLARWPEGA